MTIYHVEFGKLGHGLSGGENCLIQLIKIFQARNIHNVLLTTDNARAEYEKLGLCENDRFQYQTIASQWTEKWFGALGSYLIRTFMALRLVRHLEIQSSDVLICNSDFFPNSIPFFCLSGRFSKLKLIYWLRMLAPDWFRGFEGQYTGRHRVPLPRFIHYKLAQILYLKLMRPQGTVLVQNQDFLRRLRRSKPKLSVQALSAYPGRPTIDFDPLTLKKEYDLAWIGRFHAQKGLFEVVEILRFLKKKKPDVSLLLMGGGSDRMKKRFFAHCKMAGVMENIHYAGYTDVGRFRLLAQARLYLLTSYYEGSPNTAMEALSCGLPVVCYDLPIYSTFSGITQTVAPLDNKAIVEKLFGLLNDPEKLSRETEKACAFSVSKTWEGIADEMLCAAGVGETCDG